MKRQGKKLCIILWEKIKQYFNISNNTNSSQLFPFENN